MNELTIGHQGSLRLSRDGGTTGSREPTDSLDITITLGALRASRHVYDFDRWSGLVTFFEELESHWSGWSGEKVFTSLEGDFRLTARHDGHVRIAVELKESDAPTPWAVTGEFALDPGEEVSEAVHGLRELLAHPGR